MLVGALWSAAFISAFLAGRYGPVALAMQIAVGLIVIYIGASVIGSTEGFSWEESIGWAYRDPVEGKVTPTWMLLAGASLLLVGMSMTVDLVGYMVTDDPTHLWVDSRSTNLLREVWIVAIFGVVFVLRWGYLVIGGEYWKEQLPAWSRRVLHGRSER